MIPRTKMVDVKKVLLSPDELFKKLLPKLEQVKKEQDQNEKLEQKLQQVNFFQRF